MPASCSSSKGARLMRAGVTPGATFSVGAVGLIAAGETVETVVDEYQLSLAQVRSVLSYEAQVR
jgi:hypothetical protein